MSPDRRTAPTLGRRAAKAVPVTRSRLAWRDLVEEALAGITQRPGRAAMTALGTVLGVGAFIAVLGLTATASGQISTRFTALVATEVTVEDTGGEDPLTVPNAFPADADARVRAITGVREAGVFWPITGENRVSVAGVPLPGGRGAEDLPVYAASPGLLRAVRPTLAEGRLFDEFHDSRAERVVVLGPAAARRLGIATLAVRPAVFIDDIPFTVVGVVDDVARRPDLLFAAIVPRRTAETVWGPPNVSSRASMVIETRVGAAKVVGEQVALALRPDAPDLFRVITPADPRSLREGVASDLSVLFLLLAAVSLVIGAVGIANTTMVAVLERVPEIGLRRTLGARPRHIAGQFLTESAAVGTAGGLVGTGLGVPVVLAVALARQWTPLIEPWTVSCGPLIGALVGVLAGTYPAIRAARIEPVTALRR